jgi:hypothetical protein
LRQLDGLGQHAGALLPRRREHHLRAEETHQLASFDAEVLGHHDHERIALARAHHRQADAGVSAGRLDHRLAGLERAAALGGLDDAEREPVLDRSERVEGFDLDVEVDVRRREPPDAHHRRASDRLEDAVVLGHGRFP